MKPISRMFLNLCMTILTIVMLAGYTDWWTRLPMSNYASLFWIGFTTACLGSAVYSFATATLTWYTVHRVTQRVIRMMGGVDMAMSMVHTLSMLETARRKPSLEEEFPEYREEIRELRAQQRMQQEIGPVVVTRVSNNPKEWN